ncbi:putative F-box protein At3g10430 [Papaver somniferum]|uniref:putative F-box protein At3g10430 n=1 Tax=Papaver somniferum TaxID=3469 RepID=UPI000E6FD2FD|nr:putative F-box protein At3g10430 [Papaver somniferum]
MEYFSLLSEENTLDILSREPAESILESKLVCKTWNHLVSHHPSFYKMYLHHLSTTGDSGKLSFIALTKLADENEKFQYFKYDQNHESTTPIRRITRINFTPPVWRFNFVGSCNGLICLLWYSSVCICNPITKEYVMLPEMEKSQCDTKYYSQVSGFGYVSSTTEYKFVRIRKLDTGFVEGHIYTLGSGNGWRNLGKFPMNSPHLMRNQVALPVEFFIGSAMI